MSLNPFCVKVRSLSNGSSSRRKAAVGTDDATPDLSVIGRSLSAIFGACFEGLTSKSCRPVRDGAFGDLVTRPPPQ